MTSTKRGRAGPRRVEDRGGGIGTTLLGLLPQPAVVGLVLGSLALTWAGAAAQGPPLWGDLEPGAHEVGFERIWTLDRTRAWERSNAIDSTSGEIGRPVRIDVWYPAECGAEDRMPVRGYVAMAAPGPAFEDLVFLTRRWDEYSYRGLAGDSAAFDRLMGMTTASCEDASPEPGRFPLVVYSAGWYNRAPDNTVLAEYLASRGYVVATVPQLNPGLWTFDFTSDAASVEHQARDLEVALGVMATDPRVDRRRVAAMGYSTGGDVALLLAGWSPLVDVVVGLDASWTLGSDHDVRGSPRFRPDDVVALAVAFRRPDTGPEADALLKRLTGMGRVVATVPGADHGTFSDDPTQRFTLGTGAESARAAQSLVARGVAISLDVTLDAESSDLARVVERLRGLGLGVAFAPPGREDMVAPGEGAPQPDPGQT